MRFQAHRGVSTEYPENTMPAFEAAKNQGYQVIELDPAFTADGHCVTFHDETLNRTCRTGDGEKLTDSILVSNVTLAELQAYDAGLFMGEQFRGTRVPLLSQVLEAAARWNILVKVDNKFHRFSQEQRDRLFDIVAASGASVAFTCQSENGIRRVLARFPQAQIHYDGPVDETAVFRVKSLVGCNPLTIWLPRPSNLTSWVKVPMATPELCAMVKRHAVLGLWILDSHEQYEQAKALGADIIETTGSVKPQ